MRIFVRIECFMGVVSNTHIGGNIMFVIAYDLNIFSLMALANGVPILLTNSFTKTRTHSDDVRAWGQRFGPCLIIKKHDL